MNPYAIIGLLVGWGASMAGAFYFGVSYEEGQAAKLEVVRKEMQDVVREENRKHADDVGVKLATAIADLRPIHRTINNEVRHEREIHTRVLDNPDCGIPASTLRLLNVARGWGPVNAWPPADQPATRVPAAGEARRNETDAGR